MSHNLKRTGQSAVNRFVVVSTLVLMTDCQKMLFYAKDVVQYHTRNGHFHRNFNRDKKNQKKQPPRMKASQYMHEL